MRAKHLFCQYFCDDSRNAWERFVQVKQLGGISYTWEATRVSWRLFVARGIPRFMLIDQDGKFLNANMSRPSDGKTLEILNTLPGL